MLFTFRYFKLITLLAYLFSIVITTSAQSTSLYYQKGLTVSAIPTIETYNVRSGFRDYASTKPTASSVYMQGYVTTPDGEAIDQASITLLDTFTNVSRTTISTEKGKFYFDGLTVTHFYMVSVKSKQYVFSPDSYSFEMIDSFKNVKFTGVLQD